MTPFAHTEGLYFNADLEPQNEEYKIYQDLLKEDKASGDTCIEIGEPNNPESYYDAKMDLAKYAHDSVKISQVRDPEFVYIDVEDDFSDRLI